MTRALVLFATLLATRADAHPDELQLLGWTTDGAQLAYARPDAAVIVDARTGVEQRLPPGAPAWQAFVAHPLGCNGNGHLTPDGKLVAQVELEPPLTGAWSGSAFGFEGPAGRARVALAVVQGARTWPSASWSGAAPGAVHGSVRACWSPDGRRVAWLVRREPATPRDPGEAVVLVGPAAGPRVQLVVPRGRQATGQVAAALEGAGVFPTASRASGRARAESVVRASPAFAADARRLGAALPGGARIERLDAGSFDLVVELGAPAFTDERRHAP